MPSTLTFLRCAGTTLRPSTWRCAMWLMVLRRRRCDHLRLRFLARLAAACCFSSFSRAAFSGQPSPRLAPALLLGVALGFLEVLLLNLNIVLCGKAICLVPVLNAQKGVDFLWKFVSNKVHSWSEEGERSTSSAACTEMNKL